MVISRARVLEMVTNHVPNTDHRLCWGRGPHTDDLPSCEATHQLGLCERCRAEILGDDTPRIIRV